MSKTHKHDDDCGCNEAARNLLSTRLLDKLVDETAQSADHTSRDITRIIHAALEARRGLINDELPTSLNSEDREAILAEFTAQQARMLLCSLMRLSVTLSISIGDNMPLYVGHAAKHWEEEVLRKVAGPLNEIFAARIRETAVAQNGKHN